MDLNFTFEEEKLFLESKGYIVEDVKVVEYSFDYDEGFYKSISTIAYKDNTKPIISDKTTVEYRYGIHNVFEREVMLAFKKIVLGI